MFAVLVAEAEFQCGEATTTPLAATCNRHAVSSTPINKEVVRATVTPSQRAGLLTHQTCGAGSCELRVENGRLDRGHLDVDGHDTVHGAGHGDLNSTRRQRQCAQHASPLCLFAQCRYATQRRTCCASEIIHPRPNASRYGSVWMIRDAALAAMYHGRTLKARRHKRFSPAGQ